jgi:hypothetical protein
MGAPLLHNAVTGGCTSTSYCPNGVATREQIAVFALLSKEPAGHLPPACGSGYFCPGSAVLRCQMAVFMLKTLDPTFVPPACGTPVFGGCGGGNQRPNASVTRGQMAVFLTSTLGLTLYGP